MAVAAFPDMFILAVPDVRLAGLRFVMPEPLPEILPAERAPVTVALPAVTAPDTEQLPPESVPVAVTFPLVFMFPTTSRGCEGGRPYAHIVSRDGEGIAGRRYNHQDHAYT